MKKNGFLETHFIPVSLALDQILDWDLCGSEAEESY